MPTSVQALLVISLAITPGYICLWVTRRVIQQVSKQSDVELVISTIAFGVIVNGVTFFMGGLQILERYRDGTLLNRPWLLVMWVPLTVVLVPIFLGLLFAWAIEQWPAMFGQVGLGSGAPTLRAWDYALQWEGGIFIKVWLKEGGVIGGAFGPDSWASSDTVDPDLYIEQVWTLDAAGFFEDPVPDSAGAWIARSSINRIEFVLPVVEEEAG